MQQSQYATASDLQNVGITAQAASRFGATAITAQLQAASSLADSYLVSQFQLPLKGWDMSLTLAVASIAAYYLFLQVGYNPASPADKNLEIRMEKAMEWLHLIREKEIMPQWVDAAGGDTVEAGAFVTSDPAVGFTTRGINTISINLFDPWGWDGSC